MFKNNITIKLGHLIVVAIVLIILALTGLLPGTIYAVLSPFVSLVILITIGSLLSLIKPNSTLIFRLLFGIVILSIIYLVGVIISNIFYIGLEFRIIVLIFFIFALILQWRDISNKLVEITLSYVLLSIIALIPLVLYRTVSYGLTFGLNYDVPIALVQPLLRLYYDNYYTFAVRIGELIMHTGVLFSQELTTTEIYIEILSYQILIISILAYIIIKFIYNYNMNKAIIILLLVLFVFSFQGCLNPTSCLFFDTLFHAFKGSGAILPTLFIFILIEIIHNQKILEYFGYSERTRMLLLLFSILAVIWFLRIYPLDYMLGKPTYGLLYFQPIIYFSLFLVILLFKKFRYFMLLFSSYLLIHAEETIFYIILVTSFMVILKLERYHYIFVRIAMLSLFIFLILDISGFNISIPLWYGSLAFPVISERILSFNAIDPFSLGLLLIVVFLILKNYKEVHNIDNFKFSLFLSCVLLVILYLLPISGSYRISKLFPFALILGFILLEKVRTLAWVKWLSLIFVILIIFMVISRVLYTQSIYFFKPYTQQLLSHDELNLILKARFSGHMLILTDWFSEFAVVPNIPGTVMPYGRFMTSIEEDRYGSPANWNLTYNILSTIVVSNFSYINMINITYLVKNLPFQEYKYALFLCKKDKPIAVGIMLTPRTLRAVDHYRNLGYKGFVFDIEGKLYDEYKRRLIAIYNVSKPISIMRFLSINICNAIT
jgi:hypothetical protein